MWEAQILCGRGESWAKAGGTDLWLVHWDLGLHSASSGIAEEAKGRHRWPETPGRISVTCQSSSEGHEAIYRNLISPIASTLFLILSFRLKIFVDYFKVPLLWKCLVHSLLIQNQVNWKKQGQTITQITYQYLTMPWKIKAGYLDILLKSMCNCYLRASVFVVWFGLVRFEVSISVLLPAIVIGSKKGTLANQL